MNVSCLMMTTVDRWWFASLAIECFLSQQHLDSNDELVIVCEEEVSIAPTHPQVKQVLVPFTPTLADKLNLGVDACRGPWVMTWDDDDWHGLNRVHKARQALLHGVINGIDIVGQTSMYFHELETDRRFSYRWEYGLNRDPTTLTPYLADATMTYRRGLWKKHPFTARASPGEAGWWVVDRLREGTPYQVIEHDYVAMLHGLNSTTRLPRVAEDGTVLSDSFWKLIGSAPAIEAVLPPDTLNRYVAAAWAQRGEQD